MNDVCLNCGELLGFAGDFCSEACRLAHELAEYRPLEEDWFDPWPDPDDDNIPF